MSFGSTAYLNLLSNDKGALGRLIKAFVTAKYYAAVRLQTLTSDPFAPADLYGKFVNFSGDTDEEEAEDWALISSLAGGDMIRVHRKHGQPFDMVNRAKLIFALNKMPPMDTAFATFRRLVIAPFERVFEGEDKDRELDAKLQTPEELSGLLNLALQGIQWLKEDDGYNDESWLEVRHKYVTLQNEVQAFIDAKFIVDDNEKVEANMVREMYKEWAAEHKTDPLDPQKLGEKLAALGYENKKDRRTKVHYYHGLKLRIENKLDEILGSK
jgi:putative DNA primase/helicase